MSTIPAKQIANLPRIARESLTIATTNTIPALALTPVNAASVKLFVNGVQYDAIRSPVVLTLNAKTLTWSAANAGFSLDSSDRVTAEYVTSEPAT
ncbi:hypothetical protein H6F67_10990 [Microcoleus sp. FACHB-1515]|uniref:hypothetical protein n=1 Tax=Cyanophyceae TaxID=3028117 RepID=UPI0016885072|nr:hypothetical protein [Microcoleus sp. FACHB-1515]MBD2090380.1 hypothetical protein [Microcoleus sp. FACHB-1515]